MTFGKPEKHIFKGPSQKVFDIFFSGGDITSDGGVLLLQNIDKKLGLPESVAKAMVDIIDKVS